jgi:dTDP-glucose 4,6-dehydratase
VDTICSAIERLRPAATNSSLKDEGIASYEALKQFVPDRLGHDRRYAIDATLARRELGWEPQYDFDSGMESTVRWYLENRPWCEAVQEEASYRRERLGLA